MFSIICDSATPTLYLALLVDDNILEERYYEGSKNHSEHIVSGIDEMLKKYNLFAKDIAKFICGVGPGSYTGVRMAVAVAKMFGAFTNAKVYQISTLALMASGSEGVVLSYIDARNGNVFGGIYKDGVSIVPDAFLPLATLKENEYDKEVFNGNYKVCPQLILKVAQEVKVVDLLVPNYLRDTEAERNLNA